MMLFQNFEMKLLILKLIELAGVAMLWHMLKYFIDLVIAYHFFWK